ncbi:hypothetical protein [Lichenibacterium ramalinae]|uniref:3',5'-cyclic-nucleotide phosphodiesterase n=1 Tax=Lichenibacterium ramalinae TaxID=2316527 RepID=A0A4Q2RJZ1_9HYPH|nr:hypothetical protein [Lichenibacterium ramalinae]RYB06788.1 hypothetical protein D3272_05555 [Lichenibacterium ramalinae]
MTFQRASLCALLVLALPGVASARLRSDRDRLRAEAEHACYGDAQRLCPDAMPNEAKVEACMKTKRALLSPACGKIFDRGINR